MLRYNFKKLKISLYLLSKTTLVDIGVKKKLSKITKKRPTFNAYKFRVPVK